MIVETLIALGVVGGCVPGAKTGLKAAFGAFIAIFVAEKKTTQRWVHLGLPVKEEDRKLFASDLEKRVIRKKDLPRKLSWMAGTYLLTGMEINGLENFIWKQDVSRQLGGDYTKEFNQVVKKGRGKEVFRSRFKVDGTNVKMILEYGRRRLDDLLLKALMKSSGKRAA